MVFWYLKKKEKEKEKRNGNLIYFKILFSLFK